MTLFCTRCQEHLVLVAGSLCPVCDDRPAQPVVVPPLALDRRTPVATAATVDEQLGGAA